jgi:uncharacterized protein YndB with AHSA1/START domain
MDFDVNVRERILKPVNEVFDAVVDPKKMSNYFISGASGPIKVGRVEWEFGDVSAKVPIDVLEVHDNREIVLERAWAADSHNHSIRAGRSRRHRGYDHRIDVSFDRRRCQTGLRPERRVDLHFTRFPGGLLAMWQFLAGKEDFPGRYLVKLPQTLSEFVSDNDHTYRNEVQPRD